MGGRNRTDSVQCNTVGDGMSEKSCGSTASADGTQSGSATMNSNLWQINILPAADQPDRIGAKVKTDCQFAGLIELEVDGAKGYLVQGDLTADDAQSLARKVLVDGVVEQFVVGRPGDESLNRINTNTNDLFYVLPKAGVTDPEAETAKMALVELGFKVTAVRTLRRFVSSKLPASERQKFIGLLANDAIEQLIEGPIKIDEIQQGQGYEFELRSVPLLDASDEQLLSISKSWQLSLTLVEMQTIQQHFKTLGKDPTDAELETIAQTWSEHCSHKTLAGRVNYKDENGERTFDNMLKETIFQATVSIREELGDDDWCVSVFKDNAGIVEFDDQFNVAFKVETHNRPSAIEPYGGANTGIGGVIRDTLGTGLGAKPICNTDVFCFARPDMPYTELPPGVMHPRRIMHGVVEGVRDYGNRMGIPTVNGAIYFDDRYVGNPLVFCGNVGMLPKEKSFKEPQPNDLIVAVGGRTGRDGIHGATFSSAELTDKSEVESGGAVQIGNAITEKMVMDILLQARDEGLYSAVTDCGAGGFSSAVGEMGEELGAEVWLDKAPLKYEGLSYTEIWISEAQERMVFAVPEKHWSRFEELCSSESVEAVVIGKFVPTGNLELKYHEHSVANLSMKFLHDGRPPVVRQAIFEPKSDGDARVELIEGDCEKFTSDLLKILGSLNVASKHWVIHQYDYEVQGGSVLKPLVGVENDGPGDAAVVRPRLDSKRGLAVSCGMNPYYGDIDPYHMATSGIDEAIRNCVAVGADPNRIAILDNFCWGYTDRPETLGALVRAAIGCHDVSVQFKTPFISGKDSLNNEFSYDNSSGQRETISIPSTLLISAMGQVEDVRQCVSMDLKAAGNVIFIVGETGNHFGGSHFNLVNDLQAGAVPTVDANTNRQLYLALHEAIKQGLVRSCHDCSEGGIAVAAAEMAFAGGLGMELDISAICEDSNLSAAQVVFSESNGRLICEVSEDNVAEFSNALVDFRTYQLGRVIAGSDFVVQNSDQPVIQTSISTLKQAWQQPLDWS